MPSIESLETLRTVYRGSRGDIICGLMIQNLFLFLRTKTVCYNSRRARSNLRQLSDGVSLVHISWAEELFEVVSDKDPPKDFFTAPGIPNCKRPRKLGMISIFQFSHPLNRCACAFNKYSNIIYCKPSPKFSISSASTSS